MKDERNIESVQRLDSSERKRGADLARLERRHEARPGGDCSTPRGHPRGVSPRGREGCNVKRRGDGGGQGGTGCRGDSERKRFRGEKKTSFSPVLGRPRPGTEPPPRSGVGSSWPPFPAPGPRALSLVCLLSEARAQRPHMAWISVSLDQGKPTTGR